MKKTVILILLLFLVLMIGAGVLYSGLSGQVDTENLATQPPATASPSEMPEADAAQTTAPDMSAPDFTVQDMDGNPRKLSEFEGKPVVLNFWASWCGPCKSEMPDFQTAYETYGEQIHFLMINCTGGRETLDTAKAFLEESSYTFPVYFDTTYEAASRYGANSIPMTFFIDAAGDLVAYGQGALSAESLQKGIDMIYAA